jgi:tRNA-specific 2-thiouridylase
MVAARLGIPFQAVDLADEFGGIIQHFLDEYGRGRTPNPCAVCNRDLKLDRLLRCAEELGASEIATGHYARIDCEDGRVRVCRGVDASKDQSYQLFCVAEENLARTLLPLGELTKAEVRALAREAGLRTAEKPDSQEICFVPSNDYRRLLTERGVSLHPGRLVDTAGRRLGDHPGIEHFTIGQRRGLGIAAGRPLYVVEIDPATATVVLGSREECASPTLVAEEVNLIGFAPPPGGEFRAEVQVRYHHTAAPATVRVEGDRARVEFDEPQHAVAPGQGAAFYRGDRLLGGGWIAWAGRPASPVSPSAERDSEAGDPAPPSAP